MKKTRILLWILICLYRVDSSTISDKNILTGYTEKIGDELDKEEATIENGQRVVISSKTGCLNSNVNDDRS